MPILSDCCLPSRVRSLGLPAKKKRVDLAVERRKAPAVLPEHPRGAQQDAAKDRCRRGPKGQLPTSGCNQQILPGAVTAASAGVLAVWLPCVCWKPSAQKRSIPSCWRRLLDWAMSAPLLPPWTLKPVRCCRRPLLIV